MSAKCNGIIKFSLSLKMKKKKRAPVRPPKRLFSVQQFSLRLTKKHSGETNICVKYVIHNFCLRRFSLKCIIKKNYLTPYGPLN